MNRTEGGASRCYAVADTQSADVQSGQEPTGAMSYAFIRSLKNNERPSFNELLNHVREEMHRGGYSQKPQFSSGKRKLYRLRW